MRHKVKNLRVTLEAATPEGLATKDMYTTGIQVTLGGMWWAIGWTNSEINAKTLRDSYLKNGITAQVIFPLE